MAGSLIMPWQLLPCLLAGSFGLAIDIDKIDVAPRAIRLVGSTARAQILVTGTRVDGGSVDLTDSARYESLDSGVATIGPTGEVQASGPGRGRLRVEAAGLHAVVEVVVEDFDDGRPVDFETEIIPILTRAGCNSGACHGKAIGQNGFRLSLFGFDPDLDFDALAREGRGRRVFPPAPTRSLLLRKATAAIPHGGGRRIAPGSPEQETLVRWIARGMPRRTDRPVRLEAIVLEPSEVTIASGGTQRLRVAARYSDGTTRDVTRLSQFQSNAADLASVDDQGRVTALEGVGVAAVMARHGGQVAVSRVVVPLAGAATPPTSESTVSLVDQHVSEQLRKLGLVASEPCTDAEFARRSSLDIRGILPDPADVIALERDRDPARREKWVDRMLDSPEYSELFALKWSAILRNKAQLGTISRPATFAFHGWIRQAIAENLPYDRFVAAIVAARGDYLTNPPVAWYRQMTTTEQRQEKVDDTAQLFLGVRIQCARCHHHPYERWSQRDYYGFASFFERVGQKPGEDPSAPRVFLRPSGMALHPLTGEPEPPRPLGGPPLDSDAPSADPRQALADWMAEPANPFFARAVVNRYWKHFLGRGLVEPEDDLRVSNPPTNPELLDALADGFVRQGFDLRWLIRQIATSQAYGRSSQPGPNNASDRQNYARFLPRRIPAEVLLDAIDRVTGVPESYPGLPPGTRAVQLPDEGYSSYFLDIFGRPRRESVCECERGVEPSLSQTLHLLNSAEIHRKLTDDRGRAAALAADPGPDAEKVVGLYRLALARPPDGEELAVCLEHLERSRAEGRSRVGFEDLIWTLLNTKEFLFVY